MVNPTLSWELVGSQFYRTFEGYHLQWAVDLALSHIRVAPCGGAIAVWDRTDIIREGSVKKPQLSIYNGAGKLLAAIPWDAGAIVDAVWTLDEHLVVVSDAGVARAYFDFAGLFLQTRLPEGKVKRVEGHSKGAIIQVGAKLLCLEAVVAGDSVFGMQPDLSLHDVPVECTGAWYVVPESKRTGRTASLLLVNETLSLVDFGGKSLASALPSSLSAASAASGESGKSGESGVCVSPEGSFFAFYDGEKVDVLTSAFKDVYSFKYEGKLTWIGEDALAAADGDEVTVFDLDSKSSQTLYYEQPVLLVAEIDCARILTSHTHDVFLKVSETLVETFRLGSTAPSSILLNCIDQLDANSPKANENLSIIGRALPSAVNACLTAATEELDIRWQKRLLRAANFGKAALELYDSSRYLQVLETIRMANTLREQQIGVFLTVAEMDFVGGARLLQRLQLRKEYGTAVAFARALNLPVEPVYISWACTLIQESVEKEDAQLSEEISAKLAKYRGASYIEIARKAYDEGRPALALSLANQEPKIDKRVNFLLRLDNQSRALHEAVDSGNIDLVQAVLLELMTAKEASLPQLYRSISDNPVTVAAYKRLLAALSKNPQQLHDFYYQMDMHVASINLRFAEAQAQPDIEQRITSLAGVQKRYGELKQCQFDSKATAEYVKLLEAQTQLETDYEDRFVGKSVIDTLHTLLSMLQVQKAQQLRARFAVPDRQYWWLRLKVLVARRDWDGVWELAKSRKSPIGYLPFYEAVFTAGNKDAAASYVELCPQLSYKDRVEMFLATGAATKAQELAAKSKDDSLIAMAATGHL